MSNPILDSSESLSGRFMATALLFPERNALYADDRYYSYKELSERVHGISNELKGYDVKRVAIYCEATVETYATILALNFIGAVYIPLNPKFPDTRNQRIIAEAKPDLIISGNKRLTGPSPKTDSNGLCYILFTSGSTGEPKGVPV